MRWVLFAVLVVHGLIHFMGFAKAFGYAELPQLTQPISRPMGMAWLGAGLLMLVAAGLLLTSPRAWCPVAWCPIAWWWFGGVAVVLSQGVIVASWTDAKLGTLANALVLLAVAYGFAAYGPLSFRAEYEREVSRRLAIPVSPPPITEADLAPLPEPVKCYLRRAGVVGQARVHHFFATWRGRIRAKEEDPWMEFTAEQVNFVDSPARLFLMNARRGGLPVDVFHAFHDEAATMRVKLLSVWPIVSAAGDDMTRAETVTLLNDLCIVAPGALVDPSIRWETLGPTSVRASYTVGKNTVHAILEIDESCELVNFVSDDRLAASPDGTQLTPRRWSTPLSSYRSFGPYHLAGHGEARWHPPEGDFAYLEIELTELRVNAR